MKKEIALRYVDNFSDLEKWVEATNHLSKRTIKAIKKHLLNEDIYKNQYFNSDHMDAIVKIQVSMKPGDSWNHQTKHTLFVTINRTSSTAEMKAKDNNELISSISFKVSEISVEKLFRDYEKTIDLIRMKEKETEAPSFKIDAPPTYSGTLTWAGGRTYSFSDLVSDEHSEFVNFIIDKVKEMIAEEFKDPDNFG